jgi:hypothetical protein
VRPSLNIGWPLSAVPIVVYEHIDGPYLRCRDGQMHWLTLWERLLLALGLTNAAMLEAKHWARPNGH